MKVVQAILSLRDELKALFPKDEHYNMGLKYASIEANIFINPFYFDIINKAKNGNDQRMFINYFNLRETEFDGEYEDVP